MTWFGQAGLLLRKDVRRLRWPLAVFGAVVLARAWVDVTYRPGGHESVAPFLLRGLFYSSWVVMAGLLVHEDPLLGVTSYWKTRPIRPRALLSAKAAFALLFLATVPALTDVAVLARYGLDRAEWGVVLLRSVGEQLAWLASAGALAAVTWSMPTYLLSIGVAALVWVSSLLAMDEWAPIRFAAEWLQFPLICGTSVFVLMRQYGRRRAFLPSVVLGAAYALAPWATWLPVEGLVTRAFGEERTLPAELVGVKVSDPTYPTFSVRLGLAEAQSGTFFDGDAVDAVLELRDGRRVWAVASGSTFGSHHNSAVALMSTMPGFDWFGIRAGSTGANTVVTLGPRVGTPPEGLAEELFAIHGVARVEKYLYERVGVIPLRQGAEFSGASMTFRIAGVDADELNVRVSIDGSEVDSLNYRTQIVLVDPKRRLASRHEAWIDSGSHSMAEVSRAGRRVGLLRHRLSFLLPRVRRSSDLGELELQIWRPVLQRRYAGLIEIKDFAHAP